MRTEIGRSRQMHSTDTCRPHTHVHTHTHTHTRAHPYPHTLTHKHIHTQSEYRPAACVSTQASTVGENQGVIVVHGRVLAAGLIWEI